MDMTKHGEFRFKKPDGTYSPFYPINYAEDVITDEASGKKLRTNLTEIGTHMNDKNLHVVATSSVKISDMSSVEGLYNLGGTGVAYRVTTFNNVSKTLTVDATTTIAVGEYIYVKINNSPLLKVKVSTVNGTIIGVETTEAIDANWKYIIKINVTQSPSHAEGTDNVVTSTNGHAEGMSNLVCGDHAHAEGYGNISSGVKSHTEGDTNVASGVGSHAEGNFCTARGVYSHAEGQSSSATNLTAHAEGTSTASGIYSHAEGYGTIASGNMSHAEGYGTIASGNMSHAEGICTIASRLYTHAEGNGTVADGTNAHSEGLNTKALGQNSHAEGNTSFTLTDNTHAEGSYNIACLGILYTITGYDNTAKTLTFDTVVGLIANDVIQIKIPDAPGPLDVRVASISGNVVSLTTTETITSLWGYAIKRVLTGYPTHAEGRNSIACGAQSHAEGLATRAIGTASHAEGNGANASGQYSHAEGVQTVSSGTASHAEGQSTNATGMNAHSEGKMTTASGSMSHAEGYITTASGGYAHAEGQQTTAIGPISHAEGLSTSAIGKFSHSEGRKTTAISDGTHTEGVDTFAISGIKTYWITAFDAANKTITLNESMGDRIVINDRIVIFVTGPDYENHMYVTITNINNLIYTLDTTPGQYWKCAVPEQLCPHFVITAFDNTAKNLTLNESFGGKWRGVVGHNIDVKIKGVGTKTYSVTAVDDANKQITINTTDTITADWKYLFNNNVPIGSAHAEGLRARAFGISSHAEGLFTLSSGAYSHAEGDSNIASGPTSHAEGTYCVANGTHSHVEGYCSKALGTTSHAEGVHTVAYGWGTHSEGCCTYAGVGTLYLIYGIDNVNKTLTLWNTVGLNVGDTVNIKGPGAYDPILIDIPIKTISGNVITLDTTETLPNDTNWAFIIKPNTSSCPAHVEGLYGNALGVYSHVEGQLNHATGSCAHSEGSSNMAFGHYSHVEGCRNVTYATSSHAEGHWNSAIAPTAHAEGVYNVAGKSYMYLVKSANDTNKTLTLYDVTNLSVGTVVVVRNGIGLINNVRITAISGNTITVNYHPLLGNLTSVTEIYSGFSEYYGEHSEGIGTAAIGRCSHTEGNQTRCYGDFSHAEGQSTFCIGPVSHAEGSYSNCISAYGHAEGSSTTAGSAFLYKITAYDNTNKTVTLDSVANLTVGDLIHLKGPSITTSLPIPILSITGNVVKLDTALDVTVYTYLLKAYITAQSNASHSEGYLTLACGLYSHSEGLNSIARGTCAHTSGAGTIGKYMQTVIGQCNTISTETDTGCTSLNSELFIIGNGTADNARGNAFKVTWNGATYADGAYNSTGADYSEYFEWLDGNPNSEDRVGFFVTMDGEKIRKAKSTDDYILGIVNSTPSIVGDASPMDWSGKYIKDQWGRIQYHTVKVPEVKTTVHHDAEYEHKMIPAVIDANGIVIEPESFERILVKEAYDEIVTSVLEHEEVQPIINPDWDNSKEYITRENRPEWDAIGMMGKLLVRDDGTCVVNGYCKSNDDGIATKATSGYRVMKRVAENIILVLVK